jgi:hypothetical protein
VSLVAERTGITGQRGRRGRLFLRSLAAFAAGSDGASNALEAWDLLHGNWLLRGWTLTDVSFYTTRPHHALSADFAPHGRE